MEIMKSFIIFSTLMLYSLITYSSTIVEDTIIYKKTNNKDMFLYLTYPKTEKNNLPCIVFFNGGGWVSRKMEQFESYCKYFANKGFICIRAEYRVSKIDNSTPFESLSDARSSIRYIRKNAFSLKIDPHKIAAAGGSAGGHLAAACACIKKYDGANTSNYYQITVFYKFNLPVIGNASGFTVKGSTSNFQSNDDSEYEDSIGD